MRTSFFYSLLLHISLFIFLFVQLPEWSSSQQEKIEPAPIMVDLRKIEIAEKTNLPPQRNQKKETSKISEEKKVLSVAPPKAKPAPPKPRPAPKDENSVKVQPKEKKQDIPVTKVKSKPVPSAFSKKQTTNKKESKEESLESLLASVEKMSQSQPVQSSKPVEKKENASSGVKGGIKGDISQKLTMSELDFISTAIRKNWNLDPGAEGIDTMIIEIRISLDKTGKVYQADILDKKRYQTDMSFRAVAESARRAIYICDGQGLDSPFRILAQKRPETYNQWKDIVLRFNPMDGGVF